MTLAECTGVVDRPPLSDQRLTLPESTNPGAVFASLAEQCVPGWCDICTIQFGRAAELLRSGGTATADPLLVQVGFTLNRAPATAAVDAEPSSGLVSFGWYRHEPHAQDELIASALVQLAVHAIERIYEREPADAAAAQIDNLQIALQSNCRIGQATGVLMSLRRITADQACELLRSASQHSHRKLRDVADDVVDTGWLDPALLPRAG